MPIVHKKQYFCRKYLIMTNKILKPMRFALAVLLFIVANGTFATTLSPAPFCDGPTTEALRISSAPRIGDTNGDGSVTVVDVMQIVNYIITSDQGNEDFSLTAADINRDGFITVVDVMLAVGIIMGDKVDDPDNPYLDIDDSTGGDPADGL